MAQKTPSPLFIKHLAERDVLLGRGTGPNEHVGNRYFRDIVKAKRMAYLTARTEQEQQRVFVDIIALVYASGGKFVKKVGKIPGGKKDTAVYELVTDTKVLIYKVKQAFRYLKDKNENEVVASPGKQESAVGESSEGNSDGSGKPPSLPQGSLLSATQPFAASPVETVATPHRNLIPTSAILPRLPSPTVARPPENTPRNFEEELLRVLRDGGLLFGRGANEKPAPAQPQPQQPFYEDLARAILEINAKNNNAGLLLQKPQVGSFAATQAAVAAANHHRLLQQYPNILRNMSEQYGDAPSNTTVPTAQVQFQQDNVAADNQSSRINNSETAPNYALGSRSDGGSSSAGSKNPYELQAESLDENVRLSSSRYPSSNSRIALSRRDQQQEAARLAFVQQFLANAIKNQTLKQQEAEEDPKHRKDES